ncbi:MAG TPA: sulfurtransferase [Solirubrobacterales bacterium]|nr:sulfurtransferase [Solirubrobacterales bacterium]
MIGPFVGVEWVERQRDRVVFADCRWYLDGRSGRVAYEGGHVPGAVFVDLDTAMTRDAEAGEGRHPLPEPADFAAAMGALGIGEDETVVAYDDAGGVIAARLVGMLRVTGHEAAVLDGGLGAWRGELASGPGARRTEFGDTDREPADFTARDWPAERLATIEEVAAASAATAHGSDSAIAPAHPGAPAPQHRSADAADRAAVTSASAPPVLIDARQRERFEGEPDAVDPRAGHIPGALSVPCRENVDAEGRLLPPEELRARLDFGDGTEVISYCGSGVTACHNLLAMEQAGLAPGRLFPGSWSQWSRDPARPVQTGASGRS